MKKSWFIKFVIFLLLTAAILYGALVFLTVPHARDTSCMYGWRLEPDNSLDVILMGPSGIYTSFYSPLAYEKEGFTSYSLSVSGMSSILYEIALEEALDHHDPDLLIVDIKGFGYKNQFENGVLHKFLDVIPYTSAARWTAINTIVPEEERALFINPFLQYHGEGINFKDCGRVFLDKITMRLRGFSITKNFSIQTDIVPPEGDNLKMTLTEENLEMAVAFMESCQEKGLDQVLFIRSPAPVAYDMNSLWYDFLDEVEAHGYDFLDLYSLQDDMGIDDSHDWADDGHFNIYGSEKYTCFFADYIMTHYDINTEHSEEVTKEWDYCMAYNDHIINRLKKLCEQDEDKYHFTQKQMTGKGIFK